MTAVSEPSDASSPPGRLPSVTLSLGLPFLAVLDKASGGTSEPRKGGQGPLGLGEPG